MKKETSALETLVNKLDKLTYTESKGDRLITSEGIEVFYGTKLHHSDYGIKLPSIQFILRVSYKGQFITQWGCSSEEDTQFLVNWFMTKQANARTNEDDIEDRIASVGKELFYNL